VGKVFFLPTIPRHGGQQKHAAHPTKKLIMNGIDPTLAPPYPARLSTLPGWLRYTHHNHTIS